MDACIHVRIHMYSCIYIHKCMSDKYECNYQDYRVKLLSQTYLVSEDTNGSGCGHFIRTKPDCSKTCWYSQDENLGDGADGLSEHEQCKPVRRHSSTLNPGSQSIEKSGQDTDDPQPLLVQQPGGWENERDVCQHVDHGEPVNGHHLLVAGPRQALVVIPLYDISDNVEVDPLVGIGEGVGGEEKHHEPSVAEDLGLDFLLGFVSCWYGSIFIVFLSGERSPLLVAGRHPVCFGGPPWPNPWRGEKKMRTSKFKM